MSEDNLKTIRNSSVSEQAYLPFSFPCREWVLRERWKGLFISRPKISLYLSSRDGFFIRSFLAFLVKTRSTSTFLILFIYICGFDCFHHLFNRRASYRIRVLFYRQYTFYKGLVFSLFFSQITDKIIYFLQLAFGKPRKDFPDVFYFNSRFHENSISQRLRIKFSVAGFPDFVLKTESLKLITGTQMGGTRHG